MRKLDKGACVNCAHAEVYEKDEDVITVECHRYAPRWNSGVGTGFEESLFPHMKAGDWCSEFESCE